MNPANPNSTTNHAPKLHGGGPKTPEGKARSAQNALKHGAYAIKYPVLKTESLEAFQLHLSLFYARYAPKDEVEKGLVGDLAVIQWNLNRIAVWETQAIDSQIDALRNSPFSPGVDGISELTAAAVNNALSQPTLAFCARRHSSLMRARAITLRALAETRGKYPALDPDPGFLPDTLHHPGDSPAPEPAAETAAQEPAAPEATPIVASPEASPVLLPPFPPALIQNLSKRTLPAASRPAWRWPLL